MLFAEQGLIMVVTRRARWCLVKYRLDNKKKLLSLGEYAGAENARRRASQWPFPINSSDEPAKKSGNLSTAALKKAPAVTLFFCTLGRVSAVWPQ